VFAANTILSYLILSYYDYSNPHCFAFHTHFVWLRNVLFRVTYAWGHRYIQPYQPPADTTLTTRHSQTFLSWDLFWWPIFWWHLGLQPLQPSMTASSGNGQVSNFKGGLQQLHLNHHLANGQLTLTTN